MKKKQRHEYAQTLKDYLQSICGQCTNWGTQLVSKFEIDFTSSNELIFTDDSIEINTPVALYRRVSLDKDTEKLENLLVKTLKSYLTKDELRWEDKNSLLSSSKIGEALVEIGADIDKDTYLSSLNKFHTYNWENFLTNQIQYLQFKYKEDYYAIIQLTYLGCDVRNLSNPILVKLNEAESITNIAFSLDLSGIEGENYETLDYLDLERWQVNKERKTLLEKETGFEYSVSLSE
jgi:hypothetical protein